MNLRAPLLLAQEMRRRLPGERDGAIINIADQRVLRPNPLYFTYSLSKSALWSATTPWRKPSHREFASMQSRRGPCFRTCMTAADAFAEETASLPLQRAASVEDICNAVIYLANARSVTGQLIAIDGGQHIAWETPDILALSRRSAGGEL